MERKPVLVDLALQGGGSHGAFTWGVLDRLLEEPWLKIDGILGQFAGASCRGACSMALPKAAPRAPGHHWRISGARRRTRLASVLSGAGTARRDFLGRWTVGSSPIYASPWISCLEWCRPMT